MAVLKIEGFGGEVPRTSDTMLKQNEATLAENVKLYSGELRTWKGRALEYAPFDSSVQSIYRFYNPTLDDEVWLTWGSDVNVCRSSLDDQSDFRLYYTGDGAPKKTNWDLASNTVGALYPDAYYPMGVPAPTAVPTATDTATGSSVIAETRFYVFTYVSVFGDLEEESAPSPSSLAVTISTGRKVTVANMGTTPPTGYANITKKRIYRTLPGETSAGNYVFVAEVSIGTASYVDDLLAAALGEALATTTWVPPPDTLSGLTSMANGMMAGFVGNTVYFCEPYFHHAWPAEYTQSVPDKIVGLASYGNTLVVMTEGQPYLMVGVAPSEIAVDKVPIPEPCVSKRSIAADAYGVMYASPNGVVAIGPQQRGVITNSLFRRDEWQAYAPNSIIAAIYDGKYFATFAEIDQGNRTMVISRDDFPALAFLSERAGAFYSDLGEGTLYYLDPSNDTIYQFDADEVSPYLYEWISKRFRFDSGITWSVLRLDISEKDIDDNEQYTALVAAVIAANALITDTQGDCNGSEINEFAINGSALQELPTVGSTVTAVVQLLGEKDVIMASLNITSMAPVRIPPFRARELKIKLSGNLRVRSITLATSFEELRAAG